MKQVQTQLLCYELDVQRPSQLDPDIHPATKLKLIKVPIINLFCRGTQQNPFLSVLIKVHGFFPYIFVQIQKDQNIDQIGANLIPQIERAVQDFYPKVSQQITCAIHEFHIVKGIPMLGYHLDQYFLKIFLTEWNLIQPVHKLLSNGKCGRKYQVYEAHIHDFTKFSVDIGINANEIQCQCFPAENKQSTCDLEFITTVHNILKNRDHISTQTQQLSPQLQNQLLMKQSIDRSNILYDNLEENNFSFNEVNFSDSDNIEVSNQKNQINFQGILDGGGNNFNEELSQSEQDIFQIQQTEITQEFDFDDAQVQNLRFSDLKDIQSQCFEWAGSKYAFDHVTGLLQEHNFVQNILFSKDENMDKHSKQEIDVDQIQGNFYYQHQIQNIKFQLKLLDNPENLRSKQKQSEIQISTELVDNIISKLTQQKSQLQQRDNFVVLHIEPLILNLGVHYIFYNTENLYNIYTYKNEQQFNFKYGVCFFQDSFIINNDQNKINSFKRIFNQIKNQLNINQIQINNMLFLDEKQVYTSYLPQILQEIDPDIILSFKITMDGIGRIAIQASKYQFDFLTKISRTPQKVNHAFSKDKNIYEKYQKLGPFSNIYSKHKTISGRLIFSIQSISRQLLKLNNHSFLNICQVLKINTTSLPFDLQYLNDYFNNGLVSKDPKELSIVFSDLPSSEHIQQIDISYFQILKYCMSFIIQQQKFVQRSGFISGALESAKLFQLPIYEVLSRGSQFKINAMLLTICRNRNIIIGPTPTLQQISNMKALEALPLVSEPETKYYSKPLLIFDFSSLYPSVMAAYNICYSTVLKNFKNIQQLGPFDIQFYKEEIQDLNKNSVIYSPSSCLFVKPRIRQGVIPQMMLSCLKSRGELNTKIQNYEKELDILLQYQTNHSYSQLNQAIVYLQNEIHKLTSKQLELKMLMNTTYGYTAATFSGKMPVSEIGDSIMQISRQTLECAIKLVEQQFGGCKVVYSDTDSMFIDTTQLISDTKLDYTDSQLLLLANKIGKQILTVINKSLQYPMKIKFEKIYFPSFLISKKRYVGKSYNPQVIDLLDQQIYYSSINKTSQFINDIENIKLSKFQIREFTSKIDAKGIESIKRDSPLLVQSTISNALHILFSTSDLSYVKKFLVRQLIMLVTNFDPNLLVINKKYHGNLSKKHQQTFTNLDNGEYYSYVVLEDSSFVKPFMLGKNFIDGSQLTPNYIYYTEKLLIPALQRIFGVCGLNIEDIWQQVATIIIKIPRQELFTVQYQRTSRFSLKLTSFNLQRSSLPAIINPHLYQFLTVNIITPHNQYLFKPIPVKQDILLQRPKQICICCRTTNIYESNKISICKNCINDQIVLHSLYHSYYKQYQRIQQVCYDCGGLDENQNIICQNYNCPVFYQNSLYQSLTVQYGTIKKLLE
ncbi:DNA polymerase [Spironucleus salmonicida]|uniref:DNA polymerase n=1 Tax=Spironucleus salmonicida TaxID=348837 RepID=V6LPX5_9EUKA|nr:DNA polymerase [Spironucleus salmonicida]|eukprot:EST46293.1 DNA polymerase [Spironucleus salmonicida]